MDIGILVPIIAVMIPIVALARGPFQNWLKFKERQLEMTAQLAAERGATQGATVERLESRIRVLERIATDKGKTLADEIEALRDPQLN